MLRKYWKMAVVFLAAAVVLGVVYYYGAVRQKPADNPASYSVILYQNTDNEWETLMEGIDQAQKDYGVKVNYVTMEKNGTAQEQAQLVQREMESGADGILLAAVDSEEMEKELENMNLQIPVITLETGVGTKYTNITADNYAMGQELGKKILGDMENADMETAAGDGETAAMEIAAGDDETSAMETVAGDDENVEEQTAAEKDENVEELTDAGKKMVTVIREYTERDSVADRAWGLEDTLGEADPAIEIQWVARQKGDFSLRLFIGTILQESGGYVVALDKFSTEEAAAAYVSSKNGQSFQSDLKVYGIGNTAQTVSDLDNGSLQALVYQNEFNMGYEGIQALVEKEKKGYVVDKFDIMHKLVTRDTLYESENERLLFPSV